MGGDTKMEALELLRQQAALADNLMRQVFAPVTSEQASWRTEGSTANQIAQTFVHVYRSEDGMTSRLQGKPPRFEAEGWGERLGFNPGMPWSEQPAPDPETCRAYADAVRAGTEEFLEQATDEVMAQPVQTPAGPGTAATGLSIVLVIHKAAHMGDISALLGVQGEKGFPF
jgi:uncharacterized damage-inducible protein DinB